MSKHQPYEHTADYWRNRFVALANKVYRQRLYYQGVSRNLQTDLNRGTPSQESRESMAAMAVQLEKTASDMDFIFSKACAGLPPVEVLRITAGDQA